MPGQNTQITFDDRDEYDRKSIAEKVVQLLCSEAEISPMVIDGGWGTGKTEFCLKLVNHINNGDHGIKAVYIDAFKADHADEPLITLLSAIVKLLPDEDQPGLIQKAIPALKFGMKTSLKAGVSWLLKQDAADVADDFEKDVKKAGDEAVNYAVESLLKDHVDAEESIFTLKMALEEVSKESPVVMFVDELDRCRPDFSVSMLESIKHIFDIEAVQFVLITNSNQLRASISNCYGDSIDAQRYLDKFLRYSFELPDRVGLNTHNSRFVSSKHIDGILRGNDVLKGTGLVKDYVSDFIYNLVEVNKLSLRDVETFGRYLEIYHTLTNGEGFPDNLYHGYYLLRVFAVYIFCFDKNIVSQLESGAVKIDELAKIFGKIQLPGQLQDYQPNYEDLIISVIAMDAGIDKKLFVPAVEGADDHWNQSLRHLFGMSGYEQKNKAIKDVFNVFRLAG